MELIKPSYITSPQSFINTEEFSFAANFFTKTEREQGVGKGYYTNAIEGTYAYQEYWDLLEKYCKEGYTVGGVRITGEHFAYLNFGRIKITIGDGKKAKKYDGFPRFTDMDFYYYHELEQAKLNRQGVIVAKKRRAGFSYKGAFNTAYEYNWYRDQLCIIAAFMGEYCNTTMGMALHMINFINKYTDWGKRKLIDTRTHVKSGFKEKINDIDVESGFLSEIMTMSFKDDPFKSIGKTASIMLFEEAGKWPGLIEAYSLSKPLFSDGDIMIGIPIIYGTGGDMDKGTADFSEMFYNPEAYGLRAYENVWDETPPTKSCGWFVPDTWFKLPHVDDSGNSKIEKALESTMLKRELVKKTGSKRAYDAEVTQHPLTPAEAFLIIQGNRFPVTDLLNRLSRLQADNSIQNAEYLGDLVINEEGKIEWKLNPDRRPIRKFPISKEDDTDGCIVIYEHPYLDEMNQVPYGRYLLGTDPYGQNKSENSGSLGSTLVYDRITKRIVAEYTARPATMNEYYEQVRRLIKYYNGICLYENMIPGLFQYLDGKNETYLLMDQPEYIKDIIQNTTVNRQKGMHMTEGIKEHGEDLINAWLREQYDTDADVLNLHKLRSVPLIQELIAYNPDGNFDRCLHEGTVISTIEGFKKVEDIKIGDLVLTHKGRFRKVNYISKHKSNEGSLEFKVIGNNENLKVTNNHPILSFDIKRTGVSKEKQKRKLNELIPTFKEAKELNLLSHVLIPKRKNLKPSKYSEELLYLMGWYLADGCATNGAKNNISICFQGDQEKIADKILNIINKFVEKEYTEVKSRGFKYKRKVKPARKVLFPQGKYCILVQVTSSKLKELLVKECGGPNKKYISKELYNSSNLLPLVLGYLEGDGHQKKFAIYDGCKREVIECGSIYKDLIKQVRQILIDENIWSSICTKKPRNLSKNEVFNITISSKYINKIAENSLKFYKIKESTKTSHNSVLETKEGFWSRIKNITKIESPEFVYNFEVDEDNTYIANGIVAHNCIALMMIMFAVQQTKKHRIEETQQIKDPINDFFNRSFRRSKFFRH